MSQGQVGSGGRRRKSTPKGSWISKPRRVYDPSIPFMTDTASHQRRWEQLTMGSTRKQVVSSVAPNKWTMMNLGIEDEVEEIFVNSGLDDWKELMSHATYMYLVIEFFSTFDPFFDEQGACLGWRFSINNVKCVVSEKQLRETLFRSTVGNGFVPTCTEEQRLSIWRKLTSMDEYDVNCSPKCIRTGVWKYIHRLIATNVNTRVDEGGRVSRDDLDLLFWMEKRQPIDWFHVFTQRFIKMCNVKDKAKALGCASVIARLAEYERFEFQHFRDEFRALDTARLVTMQLYDEKAKDWIYKPNLPKRSSKKGKEPIDDFWVEENSKP